jgi:hypothetical protein
VKHVAIRRHPGSARLHGQGSGRNFTVRNIRVRFLSTTKAYLAYRYVRGDGRVVADVRFVDRDLYTKIGTRWLDDWARARDC